MSILEFLGLASKSPKREDSSSQSGIVDHIVTRLENMPVGEAEWTAAFAMVLARAARADFEVSPEESETMVRLLEEYGGLDPEQASLVAEMATQRNLVLGASDDYLATREFRRIARDGDREKILHSLFAISAADDSISLVEEEEIRQVANELGIEHAEFTSIRARFRDQREVLKGLR